MDGSSGVRRRAPRPYSRQVGAPIMVKRVMTNYYGHEIVVENSWLRGARLFVDGECQDENHAMIALDCTFRDYLRIGPPIANGWEATLSSALIAPHRGRSRSGG